MSLLTLKRYLTGPEDEIGHRKVISLLLSGIAEHGVCANAAEIATFREEIQRFRATAEADCSLDQLFVIAGATIQAMDSCNARTARLIRKQGIEMQNMISMLTETVISITGENERSTEGLRQIKQDLEQAVATEDVQTLKLRLGECLKKVCDESSRQKFEAAAVLQDLQRNVQNAQASVNADPDIDKVTGLLQVAAAKVAFGEGLKSPGRKCIVTMVVDRLQPINARFGKAVGDQLLRAMRKHIETAVLSEGDQLFRWSGPALVALLLRPESIDHVRSSLKRLLDGKIDNEVDVGGRTALIPLSVAWSAIALTPPAANVPLYIDKFVASELPRDYC